VKHFNLHTAFLTMAGTLLMVTDASHGQQSNTLYLLHQVPQSNLLNPAVQIRCKWYVGIPALASVHTAYNNTAFTWNDLASTTEWNLYGVLDQMHRADLVSVEAEAHLLSFGYRHRSFYFTFDLSENMHLYPTFPGDLAATVLNGNAPFAGETANYNALRPNGIYFREYAAGISKVFSSSWTAGLRASVLFGKASIHAGRSRSGLTTDGDSFRMLLEGDYTLNSSFPLTISQDADGNITDVTIDEINCYRLLMNRGNPGFAIDLGAIYRYSDRVTLSASLLDLGLVRWSTDPNNVQGKGSFAYEGVDTGTEILSGAFVAQMRDSLFNSFNVAVTRLPYTSTMPVQLFLGVSYRPGEVISLGAVNRNVFYRSKMHSSLTLTAHADLAGRFLAGVSWSLLNNSIRNIGAVIAYHGRGFQFHLVSDNLLGFFYPFDTRSVSLRAGFNLMMGCPRDRKEHIEAVSYETRNMTGDCSWAGKAAFRRKYRRKANKDH
jgi:hypothetical protein